MKITTNQITTYNLSELDRCQVMFLHQLVERYVRENSTITTEQSDVAITLRSLVDEFEDIKKPSQRPIMNVVLDEFPITEKIANERFKMAKLHQMLEDFPYFDSLFCPQENISNEYLETDNDGCTQFIYGKQGQLQISTWDSKCDYDENETSDRSFWLNKECVAMLHGIIETKGEWAGNLKCMIHESDKSIRYIEAYKDTDGRVSDEKYLSLVYNKLYDTISMEKNSVDITLTQSETICLYHYLKFHMNKKEEQ